jgi:hypothetical protein
MVGSLHSYSQASSTRRPHNGRQCACAGWRPGQQEAEFRTLALRAGNASLAALADQLETKIMAKDATMIFCSGYESAVGYRARGWARALCLLAFVGPVANPLPSIGRSILNLGPPLEYRDVVICSYVSKTVICHRVAHAYRPLPRPFHMPFHGRR